MLFFGIVVVSAALACYAAGVSKTIVLVAMICGISLLFGGFHGLRK